MALFRLLKIEFTKALKSKGPWIFLLIQLLIAGQFALFGQKEVSSRVISTFGDPTHYNPWFYVNLSNSIWASSIIFVFNVFIPIVAMQTEHQNGMLTRFKYLPCSAFDLYSTKLIFVLLVSFISTCCVFLLYASGAERTLAQSLQTTYGRYNYLDTIPQQAYITIKTFVSNAGMLALLLLLNFRIKNMALSVVISVSCLAFSIIPQMAYTPFGLPVKSNWAMYMALSNGASPFDLPVFYFEMASMAYLFLALLLAGFLSGKQKLVL
jgi:hypothetical protein